MDKNAQESPAHDSHEFEMVHIPYEALDPTFLRNVTQACEVRLDSR